MRKWPRTWSVCVSESFAEGVPFCTNMFGCLLFVLMYFCLKNRHQTCYKLADKINWQGTICHCFLSLSLYLHFVYDLTCSSSSFVYIAVFEKSVLQMYRQMHTQTDCCILLVHNHECKAYLACQHGGNVSPISMALLQPYIITVHVINATDYLKS